MLPRKTAFIRKAAGPRGGAQVVAANVDTAFLVASMNSDLNLRRLERFVARLVGAQNIRETTLFPRDLHRLRP